MSEYFFGLGPGHLPKACDKIAKKHGAYLCNYTDPGTGVERHWFACFNRGHPFDKATEREVMAALAASSAFATPRCDCGGEGHWHGPRHGRRIFCCDECWKKYHEATD